MKSLKNTVILTGNIGQDPEVRNTEGGAKFARMSIATDDSYKDKKGEKIEQTDWHNLVCWGNTADIVEKYVSKGDRVSVSGKLKTRSWDDKDGNKRDSTEVVVDEVLMHGKPSAKSQTSDSPNQSASQPQQSESENDAEDLPF